jgi:hypothetical protein
MRGLVELIEEEPREALVTADEERRLRVLLEPARRLEPAV